MAKTYDVYVLRCADNSLYCGIAADFKVRFEEHRAKGDKCAKYTKSHTAISIERVWRAPDRTLAAKLEYRFKQLTKAQKEAVIDRRLSLPDALGETLDTTVYSEVI